METTHTSRALPALNIPTLHAALKLALLIGLALYFSYNIASGNLSNYINQRFAWLTSVAVGLFLLLAVGSLLDLRRIRHDHDHAHHDHDHDHDHDHGDLSWKVIAVAAVPLLLGTLIPSRPLGSSAVDGNISLNAASVTNTSTFTTDPLKWNVLDWLRSFNDADDLSSFNGRQADVVGFVYREPTFPPDTFMVARFTVSCCVADAAAIGLAVRSADSGTLTADTWIRVKGTFAVGDFRGDSVPILTADSIEVVPQPEHPYLYP
jgi:putative membrane protein